MKLSRYLWVSVTGLVIAVSAEATRQRSELLESSTPIEIPEEKFPPRSTDWKSLPPQAWENQKITSTFRVDRNNFDLDSHVLNRVKASIDPRFIPSSHKLDALAKVVGAKKESRNLGLDDLVFIHAIETIQVGETYALVLENPDELKSSESHRKGYVYPILGTVKILGVQENVFVGRVQNTIGPISRDSFLVALPPKIQDLTPIPGPQPLRGYVLVNHSGSTETIAQFKEVYLDRGKEDAVQPGMVFRVFQTKDPYTGKAFAKTNFVILADVLVTQVSDAFSSGILIHDKGGFPDDSPAVLLTDVSDLNNKDGFSIKGSDALDELDKMDNKDTLGTKDSKELQQLEGWKGAPAEGPPPSSLEKAPAEVAAPSPTPRSSGGPSPEQVPATAPVLEPVPEQTPVPVPFPTVAPLVERPQDKIPAPIPAAPPLKDAVEAPAMMPAAPEGPRSMPETAPALPTAPVPEPAAREVMPLAPVPVPLNEPPPPAPPPSSGDDLPPSAEAPPSSPEAPMQLPGASSTTPATSEEAPNDLPAPPTLPRE